MKEVWDEGLAKQFSEHNWALEEEKILEAEEAGVEEVFEEPKEMFFILENPNSISLDPRIDINSVSKSNEEVSNGVF